MSDTQRTAEQIIDLMPNNTSGLIQAQTVREATLFSQGYNASGGLIPGVLNDKFNNDGLNPPAYFDKGSTWHTSGQIYQCLDGSSGQAQWAKIYPQSSTISLTGQSGVIVSPNPITGVGVIGFSSQNIVVSSGQINSGAVSKSNLPPISSGMVASGAIDYPIGLGYIPNIPTSQITGTLPYSQLGSGYPFSQIAGAPSGASVVVQSTTGTMSSASFVDIVNTGSSNNYVDGWVGIRNTGSNTLQVYYEMVDLAGQNWNSNISFPINLPANNVMVLQMTAAQNLVNPGGTGVPGAVKQYIVQMRQQAGSSTYALTYAYLAG